MDYGVRLFKEGTAAENETRRTKRGSRRLKRRKSNRLNDMKNLLKKNNLYFDNYRHYNPYEMRVKGLRTVYRHYAYNKIKRNNFRSAC